jgi:hypothetical protein
MNDTMSHMVIFLTLVETIDLSHVNREFNHIVQHRVGLRAPEILRLRRILLGWRRTTPTRRRGTPYQRNNSWTRTRNHPDDRAIF